MCAVRAVVCAVVRAGLDVNEKKGAARTEESVHVDLDDGDLVGVLVELRQHVVHVAHPRTLRVLLELQRLLQSHHTNISTRHAQPGTAEVMTGPFRFFACRRARGGEGDGGGAPRASSAACACGGAA